MQKGERSKNENAEGIEEEKNEKAVREVKKCKNTKPKEVGEGNVESVEEESTFPVSSENLVIT